MSRLIAALDAASDRTLNRILLGLVFTIVIGIPAIALVYVLDRNVDPGPPVAERAIMAGEEAVRNEPNKLSNRLALAIAYAAADRHTDAILQYEEILRVDPANRAALIGRADVYVAIGDLDAASRDYEALISEASGDEMANVDAKLETAYYALGWIALQQDRPRDAASMLAKALRINRTDADALNLMGTALLRIGDEENAVETLRRAVALVPTGWCDPYAQLAQAYAGLGSSAGAQYANGMVALCEDRPAEAEAQLAPLVGGAFSQDALIGLGLAAEERGDAVSAIDFYSRAYTADPTSFNAIAGLNRLNAPAPAASASGGGHRDD